VQQVTKIEMAVNLKTAQTLGLTMHFRCLAAPTKVIE
jgi:hypothetical protein